MWGLISGIVGWFFTKATKNMAISNFLFYLLIGVAGVTFWQVISQADDIKDLQQANLRLADVAEQRLELIHSLHKNVNTLNETMQEQNRIAQAQLEYEQNLRDKQNDKIDTIRELLKNNQCANDAIPRSVVDRLQ
ncbi:DUF2570 domain-containing protein [Pasteurellaceae bacterium USgator11]|nr:DUF2570 domain-containing protein [Pasteurellaceae bacterium USgator41]TNG96465.1 DUF2570 domain-containing protein [Pasteurellaceae bacterium UScroc12]TNH00453.1 DUF2570 domain-containing protein [Pasteurellaceae bacterium UScroc31]TNH01716.1 DUF2570 domain-containing protein [Pasteurellaceae bacterium USgator11]